ncbi:MAG: PilZ domain-containing protein [Candidatus Omnitrophota bacterium]
MYKDLEERREFPRLFKNLSLQYKNLERFPSVYVPSMCKNVSLGGMCFASYEFMPRFSKVIVTFTIEKPKVLQVKAISKISWIKRNPSYENYLAGVEFIAMTEDDRHFLSKFIEEELH